MENWTGEAVSKMHVNKISNKKLAEYLKITPQYLSEVLNGKRKPKSTPQKILSAIDEIISNQKAV